MTKETIKFFKELDYSLLFLTSLMCLFLDQGGTVLSVATLFESDQGRALNDHFFDKEFGG